MEPDPLRELAARAPRSIPTAVLRGFRELLDSAGYRVSFRASCWTECFACHEADRWVGSGVDEDDALAHVMHQMLPSHLGRHLVLSKLIAAVSSVAVTSPSAAGEQSGPPPSSVFSGEIRHEGQPAVPALPPDTSSAATPDANNSATAEPEAVRAPAAQPEVAAPTPPSRPPPTRELAASPSAASTRAIVRSVDGVVALDRLTVEIDVRAEECARMAPARLRSLLLVWICRARAIQEADPHDVAVERASGLVARRLSELARRMWPGSVLALQITTRPEDTVSGRMGGEQPRTWAEAEAAARRRFDDERDRDIAAGCDEDGWADAELRSPPPANPEALLREVTTALEAVHDTPPLGDAEIKTLEGAARSLRWVRGSAQDHVAWGAAMGRLRRIAARGSERELGLLRRLIDPRHRPSVPWPVLIQGDSGPRAADTIGAPSEAELRAELSAVADDQDRLLAWLIRALDVLNTSKLATLVAPHRAMAIAVCEKSAQHEDRRVRRRLRDLLTRLTAEEHASGVGSPAPAEMRGITDGDVEPTLGPEADALLAHVRPVTDGRRVLFVSNRLDPELEAKLTALLGVRITGCDGSLRRVQAQCERIGSGAYDLVLSATGFQLHGTDAALSRACKAAQVPYVRVDRGRPLTCVQAIARELGLGGRGAAAVVANAR